MTVLHTSYANDFRAQADALPGAHVPWLRELRNNAMDMFVEQGFPTTRTEDWKYTDVRAVAKRFFKPPTGLKKIDDSLLRRWWLDDELVHRLVFIDGRHAPELSPFNTLLNGVTVTSLARALENHPELLESRMGSCVDLEQPGFNAFNTAFMNDGAYIHLGRDVVLEQPVHLLFISSGMPDVMSVVRNVVIAEQGSKATIIESYVSLDKATCLTSTVSEILLEGDAEIEHYKLEQENEATYHMAGIYVGQDRDSRFTSHNISFGGKLVRNDIQVALDGSGAGCTLNGLYVTHGRQHVDNHTRIDHNQPNTSSNEGYKGVLDGRSRAVFNGRVIVHKDAQKTAAQQSNHNLLLSKNAEVDAKPQLEIFADDVKCAHGCTVGQLDEDALFYLRSRALDMETARNLLVYAFAADVLDRIKLQPVRKMLEQQLTGRLMGAEMTNLFKEQFVQ